MELPVWFVILSSTATLVLGNLVQPLFTNKREGNKLKVDAADKLRDDLQREVAQAREYHAKVQAQVEQARKENERLFSAVVSITTNFNEFQMTMLRESIQVSILLDTKDTEAASARLDSLIRHIRSLQVGFPTWSDPS